MSITVDRVSISFPPGFDKRAEYETPFRGYLSDVVVQVENGTRYKLYFTDTARLEQNLEDNVRLGRPYHAEPNLIVLPEVTKEAISRAVQGLRNDGYFDHLKPLP